jgi:hypothetical protein
MRTTAGAQAPRNSRELAVRNQFFTPRYVVQFLVDNTLGRIWYEMRGTKTALAEKCEYMVRKPGEAFAPRPKKDPRDLRMLDPACGSGHFLLYAFDLMLAIYEEAYADSESPKSEATGKTLAEDYPRGLEALRKEIPGLVLANNLHGVDIDPRCAQIAQLALWMRAQKAYRDFGIGRTERVQIRRSNIVVAEPLVADDQIAKEFVAKLGDVELGRVFTSLVESLNLAGDLGLLLRVERIVAHQAKRGQTGDLFAPPEERIRAALARFVSNEGSRANTRRRLFADDAAHGVALLGVAEKKFDAVLMNPPFGAGSIRSKKAFDQAYPRTKNDIYAAFVERGTELLVPSGMVGAITSRAGFFLPRFQRWREEVVLNSAPPVVVADLGLGVMDAAMVESAAYCLQLGGTSPRSQTTFIRVLEERTDKKGALKAALRSPDRALGRQWFEVDPRAFRAVTGSPFAYWVSDALRAVFARLPKLESQGRVARRGVNTNDDYRFLRLAWEVSGDHWVLHVKGGSWSPYHADPQMKVKWGQSGEEMLAERVTTRKYKFAIVPSRELYLRPGLTWTRRTKGELSIRALPAGCIFGDKGPAAIVEGDDEDELLALLAISNSKAFRSLIEFQLAAAEPTGRGGAARSYEVGVLQRTPVPEVSPMVRSELARLAQVAWKARRGLSVRCEVSPSFATPALLLVSGDNLATRTEAWSEHVERLQSEYLRVQQLIDEKSFAAYGIGADDQRAIAAGYSKSRRKAPIYWQLATPSGELLGVALHPRLQQGHALPRPERLRRAQARARGAAPRVAHGRAARRRDRSPTQAARRAGGSFVEELRAFLDEVKRVAPLWKPNLDDGVIINFAPLWRLVPQNKAWQKELKLHLGRAL